MNTMPKPLRLARTSIPLQRKNEQTTLLLIDMVLVGFFEIHPVIIAETNSSSRMPYTLTAPGAPPLTLNILHPSSLTISYPITTTQPSLLANRLLDPPCSRPQRHDPEFNPRPPLPFRHPLPP